MAAPLSLALVVVRLALVLALVPFALDWRSPLFASVRGWALACLIALPVGVMMAEIWTLRRARTRPLIVRALSVAALGLAVLCLGSVLVLEARFQWPRYQILHAEHEQMEKLGRHVIVGYRDMAELEALIERRAVAGVFIASRNVQGRDIAAIRQEIAALQDIRRRQGLPPLWIATDQEGGSVSRLSPPLTRLPPLSEVVAANPDPAARRLAVRQYAARQGRELAELGINLNFAPVVDLNHGVFNPNDRYTRIHERAIASDAEVVSEVAEAYCSELRAHGVRCTLKHFPGLGRVYEDTHQESARLATLPSDLARSDWVPFRALMHHDNAFVMLGHARLIAADPDRPASFSGAVIGNLLRKEWKHDGVLITDDFGMGAVYRSAEGIAGGSVAALNAGVDLILVSFDTDQYFVVMRALIEADRDGRLRQDALRDSDRRLGRAIGR